MFPVKRFTLLISIFFYAYTVCSGQPTRQYHEDFRNPGALETFIDSLIASEMEEEFLPGVGFVLVKDGKKVLRKGYGKANLQSGISVDPSRTIFRIGSITKVFTAMALMQLVDRGEIELSDEVNDFLDDSLRIESPYKEPIRIWHLLSHTAGLDQIFQDRLFDNKEERPDIEIFLKNQLRPIRSPGLVSTYDTYGITLAGHIVERASGLSYADYMRKHIFGPVGMASSFVEVDRQNRDRLAVGYGYEDGEFVPQPYEWYASTPASSIDATIDDMTLFLSALLGDGGALFSPETAKMVRSPMFTNYPGLPGFAYGFWEEYQGPIRAIYHGGIMRGYTGRMYLLPEFNLGFYLVYNRDLETGPDPRLRFILTEALMQRWFGPEPITQKPDTVRPFPVETEKFDGVYADNLYCHTCFEGTGGDRSIFPVESRGDGKIFMWGSMFYAVSPNTFLTESGRTKAVFLQGFDGEVRHMGMNIWPNMYEKLGEQLINEVLKGTDPAEVTAPIEAMTWRGMKRWEEAIDAYKDVIRLRPEDPIAHYYMAYSLAMEERYEEAVEHYMETYELDKWKPWTAYAIAESYIRLGNKEKAIEWIGISIKDGFDKGEIQSHPMFQSLEGMPAYDRLFN